MAKFAPVPSEQEAPLLSLHEKDQLPSAEKDPRRWHGAWWNVIGSCSRNGLASCLLSWQLPCIAFGWNAHRVGRNGYKEALRFFFLTVLTFAIIRGSFEVAVYLRCGPGAMPMHSHHGHGFHHHGMHGRHEPWLMGMGRPLQDPSWMEERPDIDMPAYSPLSRDMPGHGPCHGGDSDPHMPGLLRGQVEPMPAVMVLESVTLVSVQSSDEDEAAAAIMADALAADDSDALAPDSLDHGVSTPGFNPDAEVVGDDAVVSFDEEDGDNDEDMNFGPELYADDDGDEDEEYEGEDEEDDVFEDEEDEAQVWDMLFSDDDGDSSDWQELDQCAVQLGHVPCALMALTLAAAAYATYFAARRRQALREQFGIQGSFAGDLVLWAFCPTCALAQETRTLMENNVEEGIWHGPSAAPLPATFAPPPTVLVYSALPSKAAPIVSPTV